MKTGKPWIIIGGGMFILGMIVCRHRGSHICLNPEGNKNLEFIKNMGTFVGLSGMGVTLAGVLLYLINRNEKPIKKNYDV